jgi:hypothetical protein
MEELFFHSFALVLREKSAPSFFFNFLQPDWSDRITSLLAVG